MAKKVISCNRIRFHNKQWIAFDQRGRGYQYFDVNNAPTQTIVIETKKLFIYDRVVDAYNKRVLTSKKGKLFRR